MTLLDLKVHGLPQVCMCACVCAHIHVHSYTRMCVRICVHACTHVYVCAHMCVCVCLCIRPHNSPTPSLTSPPTLCTHTSPPKVPAPSSSPPRTLHSGPHLLHPPGVHLHLGTQTGGGTGMMECRANGWKMRLFICMARICLCFIHPLSQPKSSPLILPAGRGQIGSRQAHPQKPNIDFQLSFNFAPVFICSFHFFQMAWRKQSCNL